jgi:hypothetical protein
MKFLGDMDFNRAFLVFLLFFILFFVSFLLGYFYAKNRFCKKISDKNHKEKENKKK